MRSRKIYIKNYDLFIHFSGHVFIFWKWNLNCRTVLVSGEDSCWFWGFGLCFVLGETKEQNKINARSMLVCLCVKKLKLGMVFHFRMEGATGWGSWQATHAHRRGEKGERGFWGIREGLCNCWLVDDNESTNLEHKSKQRWVIRCQAPFWSHRTTCSILFDFRETGLVYDQRLIESLLLDDQVSDH